MNGGQGDFQRVLREVVMLALDVRMFRSPGEMQTVAGHEPDEYGVLLEHDSIDLGDDRTCETRLDGPTESRGVSASDPAPRDSRSTWKRRPRRVDAQASPATWRYATRDRLGSPTGRTTRGTVLEPVPGGRSAS